MLHQQNLATTLKRQKRSMSVEFIYFINVTIHSTLIQLLLQSPRNLSRKLKDE